MGDPQLLIFDNDGVLVDSEPIANAVLVELLDDLGHPIGPAEVTDRFLGSTLGGVRLAVEAESGRRLAEDFEHRYHQALFVAVDAGLEAVPGVATALDRLEHLPRCVASGGSRDRIARTLERVGLLGRFDAGALYSAEDVAHSKPAPDLFLHVAADRGVVAGCCVVVEDSPAGVQAGRAAGMTVVGFAGRTPVARLGGADVVIADMAELPEAIAGL